MHNKGIPITAERAAEYKEIAQRVGDLTLVEYWQRQIDKYLGEKNAEERHQHGR